MARRALYYDAGDDWGDMSQETSDADEFPVDGDPDVYDVWSADYGGAAEDDAPVIRLVERTPVRPVTRMPLPMRPPVQAKPEKPKAMLAVGEPAPPEKRTRRKRGTVPEDAQKRRPVSGTKHLYLRNVPLATMTVLEAAAKRRGENVTAYVVQMLNRYAEKHG